MINIIYCPDHTPTLIVVASPTCGDATDHYHADESKHPCIIVREIDEPALSGNFPGQTKDDTTVNNIDEWFTHLAQYIP